MPLKRVCVFKKEPVSGNPAHAGLFHRQLGPACDRGGLSQNSGSGQAQRVPTPRAGPPVRRRLSINAHGADTVEPSRK